MQLQQQASMRPEIRFLFLKIIDGYTPHNTITVPLYHLYAHFPQQFLEKALRRLVNNGLTGQNFINYFYNECGGSALQLHRRLLEPIELEKAGKIRIIAGKNFRE